MQLGVGPVRIDLLSSLSGLESFEEAWRLREDAKYCTVDTHYLSLDHLIANKRSTGRDQDRADLDLLRRV